MTRDLFLRPSPLRFASVAALHAWAAVSFFIAGDLSVLSCRANRAISRIINSLILYCILRAWNLIPSLARMHSHCFRAGVAGGRGIEYRALMAPPRGSWSGPRREPLNRRIVGANTHVVFDACVRTTVNKQTEPLTELGG